MSTLATLRTELARAVRDPDNVTFSTDELNDVINQGIAQLGYFHPREAVESIALSVNVASYTTDTLFTKIYRLDIYKSGVYSGTLASNTGDGPNSGWELHAGIIYFPPAYVVGSAESARIFGYAAYPSLTTDGAEPDFDVAGEFAVKLFAQVELFGRLVSDRSAFQQWQANPANTDVTALSLESIYAQHQRRWADEKRSLRRMQKTG